MRAGATPPRRATACDVDVDLNVVVDMVVDMVVDVNADVVAVVFLDALGARGPLIVTFSPRGRGEKVTR